MVEQVVTDVCRQFVCNACHSFRELRNRELSSGSCVLGDDLDFRKGLTCLRREGVLNLLDREGEGACRLGQKEETDGDDLTTRLASVVVDCVDISAVEFVFVRGCVLYSRRKSELKLVACVERDIALHRNGVRVFRAVCHVRWRNAELSDFASPGHDYVQAKAAVDLADSVRIDCFYLEALGRLGRARVRDAAKYDRNGGASRSLVDRDERDCVGGCIVARHGHARTSALNLADAESHAFRGSDLNSAVFGDSMVAHELKRVVRCFSVGYSIRNFYRLCRPQLAR